MNPPNPTPMRRRNLTFAALLSVVLIAGVAWWGEQTHFRVFRKPPEKPPALVPFLLDPDPPPPVEEKDAPPKPVADLLAPPVLPDSPAKPMAADFIVPIEPPRPNVDIKMDRIPTGPGGQGLADRILNLSDLDQAPVAIYKARPIYPGGMRTAGISGEALIDFVVDPSGNVRNAVVAHSSQPEFEESACSAVGKWRFRPGRKGGRAVFVHMQVPIVFSLSEDGGS
jgi:periplasmic protein TonB